MPRDVRSNRFVAWALALLIFALGAAAGVVAGRTVLAPRDRDGRRGRPTPQAMLQRMRDDLDLSDDQARAVAQVLDARWRALAVLFDRVDPEAERIRQDGDDRIRALLTPAQRERFDAQVAEAQRRHREMRQRLRSASTAGTPAASGSAR